MCGTPLAADDTACPNCGADVAERKAATETQRETRSEAPIEREATAGSRTTPASDDDGDGARH